MNDKPPVIPEFTTGHERTQQEILRQHKADQLDFLNQKEANHHWIKNPDNISRNSMQRMAVIVVLINGELAFKVCFDHDDSVRTKVNEVNAWLKKHYHPEPFQGKPYTIKVLSPTTNKAKNWYYKQRSRLGRLVGNVNKYEAKPIEVFNGQKISAGKVRLKKLLVASRDDDGVTSETLRKERNKRKRQRKK